MAEITAVCVLHALLPEPGDPGTTAIDKRAVVGPVHVGPLGLAGDRQMDVEHHGGPEQAVYLYADEDAAWWAGELGREIPAGLFGENLRTSGLDVSGARIGQRWRIGDAGLVVEVTAPRTPCSTFARRMDEPHWVKRFTVRRAPGAYVRVVTAGPVRAGDAVVDLGRPQHAVTVADVMAPALPGSLAALLDAEVAGVVTLTPRMRAAAERATRTGDIRE